MSGFLVRLVAAFLIAALSLGTLPAPAANAFSPRLDKIDPVLQSLISSDPQAPWPVIVEGDAPLKSGNGKGAGIDRANRAAERAKANRAKPKASLSIVGSVSALADYAAITALSRDPSVSYVYYDAPLQARSGDLSSNVFQQVVDASTAWSLGYTGKGVAVAVLDSGINPAFDLTHPINRVIARADFVGDNLQMADPGGHGTHVAGIIAGNGRGAPPSQIDLFRGVAPEANLVDVRVVNASGTARISTVIAGVQWVVQHSRTYNIRVMNVSLGAPAPANYSYRTDPLAAAMEIAWLAGIVVVTPAGNNGPGDGTIDRPGADPIIITVGALDDANTVDTADDTIPSFASRGPTSEGLPKPDLVAPGRRIISLHSPGSYLDRMLPERTVTTSNGNTYFRLSGSSMSAAMVSGVAALLVQKEPDLRPDQVKHILTSTTTPTPGSTLGAAGKGVLNAAAALTSTGGQQANQGRRPADAFARALLPFLKGRPLAWRDARYAGRDWAKVNWNNIFWDKVTWDNIFWDNIFWDNVFWDNIFWDNIFWDNIYWDAVTRESPPSLKNVVD